MFNWLSAVRRGSMCLLAGIGMTFTLPQLPGLQDDGVARIGDTTYASLQEAINSAKEGETTQITLLADVNDGCGIEVADGSANKSIEIDFDGHTYVVANGLVGPEGLRTQAMYFAPNNRVSLKNGTISVAAHLAEYMMTNYADLTLDNMTVDATNAILQEDIIDCWGDSQTGGGYTSGITSWVSLLSKRIGYTLNGKSADHSINNFGHGGDSSTEIAVRFGSMPLYIDSCVISKSTSVRDTCLIYAQNRCSVKRLGTLWGTFNPVTVDGISCYIRNPNTSAKKTICRVSKGKEDHVVKNGTRVVVPYGSYGRDRVTIIMSGANKGYGTTYEDYVTILDDMIAMIPATEKRYIIIPSFTVAFVTPMGMTISEVEEKMAERYGEHFLNVRTYLIENGLSENGLEPTATDLSYISKGRVPKSLMHEGDYHLNQKGFISQTNVMYNKLVELGYLKMDSTWENEEQFRKLLSRPLIGFYGGQSVFRNSIVKFKDADHTGLLVDGGNVVMESGGVQGPVSVAAGAMSITGGDFKDKVTAADAALLDISGGLFVNPVLEESCADGYVPLDYSNGTYTVVGKGNASFNNGDVNQDGFVNISDAICVCDVIGGGKLFADKADVNNDGVVDISDVVTVINFILASDYESEP